MELTPRSDADPGPATGPDAIVAVDSAGPERWADLSYFLDFRGQPLDVVMLIHEQRHDCSCFVVGLG